MNYKEIMNDKSKECIRSTRGRCIGYKPQWRFLKKGDAEEFAWKDVPIKRVPASEARGVPEPFEHGGILSTINMLGHAQAWALAWEYAAVAEQEGEKVEVGICAYEVDFEINATAAEQLG